MSSKSVRCGDCLKLDVWILLRPFGWTAIAIKLTEAEVPEVMEAQKPEQSGREGSKKIHRNVVRIEENGDISWMEMIRMIQKASFYFYHQLDKVTSKNTFNSQTPPWYPPLVKARVKSCVSCCIHSQLMTQSHRFAGRHQFF